MIDGVVPQKWGAVLTRRGGENSGVEGSLYECHVLDEALPQEQAAVGSTANTTCSRRRTKTSGTETTVIGAAIACTTTNYSKYKILKGHLS